MAEALRSARIVPAIRRRLVRRALRSSRSSAGPEVLVDAVPEQSLLALRRVGLDPAPALGRLRDEDPVSRLPLPFGLRGWLVTGDPEVRLVLAGRSEDFSTDYGTMVGEMGMAATRDPGGLGMSDPPDHTRLRHLVGPHFTRRAIEPRAEQIRRVVDEALGDLDVAAAGGEPVDLHRLFATRIPSEVIMDVLGIDPSHRQSFHEHSTRRFDLSGGAGASVEVIGKSVDLLLRIIAEQRRDPGPGLIGTILREHGHDVGNRELAGLVDGVVTGGLETTASMLTLGTLVLLQRPDLRDQVLSGDAGVAAFVEEVLRHLSVVQVGFPRFVRRDVELAGRSLRAGDIVVCSLSAANRDPRRGDGLDEATAGRSPVGHLAFGHGIHRCVGAELARLELRLAYPALLRRYPDLRLAVAPEDVSYRRRSIVFGVDALPVHLR